MDLGNLLNLLKIPNRPPKPRHSGLSSFLDKGLGCREVEDLVDGAAPYVDMVKLGWGTGLITPSISEKIRVYDEVGIPVYFGGTLFEVFLIRDAYESFKCLLSQLKMTYVEISDGTLSLGMEEKCEYIRDLSKDFTVLSEVGRKDPDSTMSSTQWVESIRAEKEAGAWKVIAEARESGTAGICDCNGKIRGDLITHITGRVDCDDLIFEAPKKKHQVWFIERFGRDVNLGNINPADAVSLETLRLGLRSDTMMSLLGR